MGDVVSRPGGFAILLPVKSPGTAKSRMASLSDVDRARLAGAFARDAVDACLQTAGVALVMVVSDDAAFAATLADRGAVTCADPGGGLNAALRHAAAAVHETYPDLRPVALCADLPALAPGDLGDALAFAATTPACFVRDADGTGTTFFTTGYDDFHPLFGPESAQRHAAAGATEARAALPTLRRDVDDLEGLRDAMALGVGPSTAAALALVALTA